MFNFWTKKKQEDLMKNKENLQNFYQNATENQKSQIQQIAQNTQNQNFTAAEYNKQAREDGDQNWQTAYRRDILGINDEEKLLSNSSEEKGVENSQTPQNQNNIPRIENDSRVTFENKQTETIQNGEQKNSDITGATQNQVTQNSQTPQNQNIDYQNWNVEAWKSRGSSKEELENAVEKKYGTVASWKEDGSLEAVINGEKFSWKIDTNGNPVKTSLGSANQAEINKNQVFQMIQNGNTTSEINDYIHKNNLQDDPDVKNQIKQKYISDYEKPILQKYSGLSLQDLHKAVKNGEILPGTEVFNKLPQASAYNQYAKSFAVIDARKDSDFSALNTSLDIEKIVEKSISKFFDTKGIEEITERFKNDEEIKQYRADVYESQKKIIEYKRQMKDIGDEVRRQMGGAPESMIMAEISKRAENIYRGIETETALMNASLGMIGDRKGDFEVEMKMLGYKDGLKKEQFKTATDVYYTERARMDKKEQREYEAKTEELAWERQKAWEMEKMEWSEKYKGGTYETDVNGNLLYIKNGVATKVRNNETGEVIGMVKAKNYQDQMVKNDVGGYDVIRTYNDGRMPDVFSVGANGKLKGGATFGLMDAISSISEKGKGPNGGLWCGEGVNHFLKNIGVSDFRIGNSWQSKKDLVDSSVPVVGGLVAYNIGGKYGANGHIGIVTGVNGAKVQITDWNRYGDGKKNTYEMEISSVINNDGGFINNFLQKFIKTEENIESYDDANIPLYEKYLSGKLNKEDWKKIGENEEIFKQKAYLYSQEKQAKQNDFQGSELFKIYTTLKNIRNKPWGASNGWTSSGEDFQTDLKYVKNNLTFDKLTKLKEGGATFGSLSEGEMRAIDSAASKLEIGLMTSDINWKKRVDFTLEEMEKTFNNLGFNYEDALKTEDQKIQEMDLEQIQNKYSNNSGNAKKDLSKSERDAYFQ